LDRAREYYLQNAIGRIFFKKMLEGIKVGQKSAENEIMPGKSDEWHLAI
jgi:hypothetical protein